MKYFMALFQLYFNARFLEAKLFHFCQVLAKNISKNILKVHFKLSIEIWIIAIKLSRSTILNLKIHQRCFESSSGILSPNYVA